MSFLVGLGFGMAAGIGIGVVLIRIKPGCHYDPYCKALVESLKRQLENKK